MSEAPDNRWKRFPFVDKFDEEERFYAQPHDRSGGFTRASLHLPMGRLRNPPEGGHGRVLSYSMRFHDEHRPCFTFEYLLTCFGIAALRVRKEVFQLLQVVDDQDLEYVEIYVRDAFRMKIHLPLNGSGGHACQWIEEHRDDLDAKARLICAQIFRDHYVEAWQHYAKWYDWTSPDMDMYLNPDASADHIAQRLSDTTSLTWIPETAEVRRSKKALDEERYRRVRQGVQD